MFRKEQRRLVMRQVMRQKVADAEHNTILKGFRKP